MACSASDPAPRPRSAQRRAMEENCKYPIEVIDFIYFYENKSAREHLFPCELRIFWMEDLRGLVILVRFLLMYVSAAIIILGLFFNVLAFSVLNSPPLNTTSLSVYLRALAISDNGALLFSYGIGILRAHLNGFNEFFMSNKWVCELHKVTGEMFFLISAWIVVALTLERWVVIRSPFGGYNCTTQSAEFIILILGICLSPIALSKIWFAGMDQDSVFGHKSCISLENGWANAVYLYIASVIWIPLIFISIGNIGILCEIWSSAHKRSKLVALDMEQDLNSETQKLTCLLLSLSATYLFLLLPLGIVETLELYWDGIRISHIDELYITWMKRKLTLKWTRGLCFFLYEWNFAFNFFLYCLSGDKFRSDVKNWFDKNKLWIGKGKRKKEMKYFSSFETSSIMTISRSSVSSGSLLSDA